MSERRHLLLASALLLAIALVMLLSGLSTQPFEVYDEGLYGMYARTALRFDTWLHVVNTAGEYPSGLVKFSKPPLSIWAVAASMHVLGPSLLALRLPFALASLGTAFLMLAFGRLLAPGTKGTWLGFLWGVLFVVCQGTTSYGRTATIETLLVAFVMLALYAHARAMSETSGRSYGWAALAGAAIAGAFMTKQLVCALAILPIAGVELLRSRTELRASILRLTVCFGLPALGIGAWLVAFYAKVGDAAFDVLWKHAVVQRVAGFDGTHHQNFLNRVAGLLDVDAAPMSWPLGLLGLTLMLLPAAPAPRNSRDAALLVVGGGICGWLAFDVGSLAILPWYVYSLLPALALGQAWLVVHALYALLDTWPSDRKGQLTAAAGLGSMVISVGSATRLLMPSLLAVALGSACVVLALSLRVAVQRRRILIAGAATWVCVLLLGALARAEYRATEPQTYAELGKELFRRGAKRISLDGRSQLHPYARTTFFGVDLTSGSEPWSLGGKRARSDARIQMDVIPVELQPRPGVQLIRGVGAYAVMGDLASPPFAAQAVERLLERGPLTFEAEQLTTGRPDTLAHVSGASGGAVRRSDPGFREQAEPFSLVRGTTPRLPVGHYTVKFWITLQCGRFRNEQLGQAVVNARGRKIARTLRCGSDPSLDTPATDAQVIQLDLTSPASVDLSLQITQGAVTLDRITFTLTPNAPDKPK